MCEARPTEGKRNEVKGVKGKDRNRMKGNGLQWSPDRAKFFGAWGSTEYNPTLAVFVSTMVTVAYIS